MTLTESFNKYVGQFAVDPKTVHHFTSGLYAKQMVIPKGFIALSHKHIYDHLSILAQGKVLVTTDTGQKEFKAPACITIEKNMHHAIQALEDSVWFCIHATEETDKEQIDKVLIQKEEV